MLAHLFNQKGYFEGSVDVQKETEYLEFAVLPTMNPIPYVDFQEHPLEQVVRRYSKVGRLPHGGAVIFQEST